MILWLVDSPKYGISDKKTICDYIDKHVTAEIPGNCFAEIPHFLNCQFHKHGFTCKKRNRLECRFKFPKKPFPTTRILEPLDIDSHVGKMYKVDEISPENLKVIKDELKNKLKSRLKNINNFLDSLDFSKEGIYNMTFEEFLKSIELTEIEYEEAISYSLKRPQVFLKRDIKGKNT